MQQHVKLILSTEITTIDNPTKLYLGIKGVLEKIQNKNIHFENRHLFENNYLQTRLLDEKKEHITKLLNTVRSKLNSNPKDILKELGWKLNNAEINRYDNVSIIITDKDNFSIREKGQDTLPSDLAVSELSNSSWVILTNGKRWRLYSTRVSATTTNYFEIILDNNEQKIKYLIALFGFDSYINKAGIVDIDYFFDEGKNYAKELEDNISDKIMKHDGLFVKIIKGVLDFDIDTEYTKEDLESAKQDALKILYRIWFLAYAEATNLLPIRDSKYAKISLQSIRTKLDSYNIKDDKDDTCWKSLLKLFDGVRNGSSEYNLPQYNGHLFAIKPSIDSVSIKNKFLVPALTDLLKRDDEAIDYGSFDVRHLGHIFENLMEYSPKQANDDLMLLKKGGKLEEVKTKIEAKYFIKKGDIYLASKAGITRKSTASYYTPEEIVTFLVDKGTTPIFTEREKHIQNDIKRYNKNKSEENAKACIDRLLDIQVLDPAMGSGHFLVKALNKITEWVTNMLGKYPAHPLNHEIKRDRDAVLKEQNNRNITIDKTLLTDPVLLKRRVMKRCIFGVDINPMAVDLAKLSLWLDSFAIGVPLTYMDHHIKVGDSTIGMFLSDMKDKKNTSLDEYDLDDDSNKLMNDIVTSSDVTINQVHESEKKYQEYQKRIAPKKNSLDALTVSNINPKFLPKKTSLQDMIHRFGKYSKSDPVELVKARKTVIDLSERHKFFHWDLEMSDVFKNARHGFDCIIGNPPWEKVKPNNAEFFTPIDPTFKDLTPNIKKKKRKEELLKNKKIKEEWKMYEKHLKQKSIFCNSNAYKLQGEGDKDLWKLILERALNLVAENGTVSMIIPSRVLFNPSSMDIRKQILEKNILSMYVFENNEKIFQIHSSYRFLLLTIQNNTGSDKFPVGFYLHYLESLKNKTKEQEKFYALSKTTIKKLSSNDSVILQISNKLLKIFEKIFHNGVMLTNSEEGLSAKLASEFHKTNDSEFLSENKKDWFVFEGKFMHQYTHEWLEPKFTIDKNKGLKRLERTKVFCGKSKEIHGSYRLVFRDIADPTNVRSCISTIIFPHTFHTHSLHSIVLSKYGKIILDSEYNKKIAYLCGVLNSITFDFVVRANAQNNLAGTIFTLPFPKPKHESKISNLVAKLLVGTPEFAGFADSLHIPNKKLKLAKRIKIIAEIDALVADSYDLTVSEYETIIHTFTKFKRNPDLYEMNIEINEKNSKPYLYQFYGEMADAAIKLYKEMKS